MRSGLYCSRLQRDPGRAASSGPWRASGRGLGGPAETPEAALDLQATRQRRGAAPGEDLVPAAEAWS